MTKTDVLDKIKVEIADMPKIYPFIDHIDTYVKYDDVIAIIDKIGAEIESLIPMGIGDNLSMDEDTLNAVLQIIDRYRKGVKNV